MYFVLVFVFIALQLADIITTHDALSYGSLKEANWFCRLLQTKSFKLFVIIKIMSTLLISIAFYFCGTYGIIGLATLNLLYIGVLINNIIVKEKVK